MPHPVLSLTFELCLLLAVAQAGCLFLARGLGVRLEWRAAALGLALPLLFLSPFLLDDTLLAPTGVIAGMLPLHGLPPVRFSHLIQSDTIYQFLPWELEVRHALRAHRLPLWSDLLDGGSSPWINPQAGVLSPLAMLARAVPIPWLLLAMLALKMLVACEGTWLLARQAGVSRASALLAAAGFTLGGGVMSWALFPHTAALAWVPWLTLGSIRLFRRPRPRTIAATAAIAAALLLSGHPETAAAGGLLAAVCGCALRRRRLPAIRALAAAGAAALLGFALAAPQLLPFLHALPAAQRTRDMLALAPPPHDARLLAPSSWFLSPVRGFVLAPLNPRVYGIPYQEPFHGPDDWVDALSGYTGLVAFAGAAVVLLGGAGGWRRSGRGRPWLAFAIGSLLLAAGFVPVAMVLERVPALRLPAYSRLLPVACLALAVAGGLGTDLLLRRRRPAAIGARPLAAIGGRLAAAMAGGRGRILAALGVAAAASLAADHSPYVLLLWALLVSAALLAPWSRRLALAALVLGLGLDLVPWAQRLLPRGQPALFYPDNDLTRVLARETGAAPAAGPSKGAVRVASATTVAGRAVGIDRLVYPALLPVYGIAEVRPNNVMAPAPYLRALRSAFAFDPNLVNYYSTFSFPDHPLLSFLGVRAVVGNIWLPRPRTLVPLVDPRLLPFVVFRNPRALPRWFLPAGVEVVERGAIDRWIAGLGDAGRVAVFRDELGNAGADAGWLQAAAQGGEVAAATALAAAPGHVLLAVPAGSRGGARLLATSLPGPAGWRARGGGRRLAELTIDGAFLGVLVPAGVETVELVFRPPGLIAGTALSALALPLVLLLAARGSGTGRTKIKQPAPRI